jgi:hypothetical protein
MIKIRTGPNEPEIDPAFGDFSLPEPYLAKIGEIVVRWAFIEQSLRGLVMMSARIPYDLGRTLTVGMELTVLCGTLKTITSTGRFVLDADLRQRIRQFADDVRDSRDDRHGFAHGLFFFDIDKPVPLFRVLQRTAEHRLNPAQEAVPFEELERISEQARILGMRGASLGGELACAASSTRRSAPA